MQLENPTTLQPLKDPLTGLPDRVATRRLVEFAVAPEAEENAFDADLKKLRVGSFVAWKSGGEILLLKTQVWRPTLM